jgi:hypothetical protein
VGVGTAFDANRPGRGTSKSSAQAKFDEATTASKSGIGKIQIVIDFQQHPGEAGV